MSQSSKGLRVFWQRSIEPWVRWFEIEAWRLDGCDERGANRLAQKWGTHRCRV